MKFLKITIVVILVCQLLSGCSITPFPNTDTTSNSTLAAVSCTKLKTIADYSEYQAYIDAINKPNKFLDYEAVCHFGEFDSFVCKENFATDSIADWCLYNVIGSTGQPAIIKINYTEEMYEDRKTGNITTVNQSDMRFLPDYDVDEHGKISFYVISDICYHYKSGKLLHIYYRTDGITYIISGSSYLFEHPVDSSVIGQLLNIQGKSEIELTALFTGN